MSESTFVFGQRGSHYFECPTQRDFTRLPAKLSSLLSSAQLHLVHHVALGYEDSFLITWRDIRGQDRIDSSSLPPELTEFLFARDNQQRYARNIPEIRCSLGPYNSSFFAHDGASYRWMNLPEKLLTALRSRIKAGVWVDSPRLVVLGANSDFVLITESHASVWSLHHYSTLSNLLASISQRNGGTLDISSIALHAYRFGGFVVHERNGTITHGNVPPHSVSGLQVMRNAVMKNLKAIERKPTIRSKSEGVGSMQRQPSNLQQRAQLRREWSEHKNQFTAQAKGIKLSISLSIGVNGIARLLG